MLIVIDTKNYGSWYPVHAIKRSLIVCELICINRSSLNSPFPRGALPHSISLTPRPRLPTIIIIIPNHPSRLIPTSINLVVNIKKITLVRKIHICFCYLACWDGVHFIPIFTNHSIGYPSQCRSCACHHPQLRSLFVSLTQPQRHNISPPVSQSASQASPWLY